jgi:hypothetical protein
MTRVEGRAPTDQLEEGKLSNSAMSAGFVCRIPT